MGMSTAEANAVLDARLAGTLYVGFYTAAPTDAGGGTECTGNGYARITVTDGFDTAASRATSNTDDLETPIASGGWGGDSTIRAFGIFTASSGGTLKYWGLCTNKVIAAGDSYKVPAGDLDISVDASS